MPISAIEYYVKTKLGGHRFVITATIRLFNEKALDFSIPVWIAGSYTRRDFAKNIYAMSASVDDQSSAIIQTAPSEWHLDITEKGKKVVICYEYYARDYSVRGCYLDDQRLMFNPGCACILLKGGENLPHSLYLDLDESRSQWQLTGGNTDKENYSHFEDYETLADTPLIGAEDLIILPLAVGEVPHDIAICGLDEHTVPECLQKDIQMICQQQVKMFGAQPEKKQNYHFLLFLTENITGGLEHLNSCMLMAARRLLSSEITQESESYVQLLGLFSHEYFHSWNIKSMRPKTYINGYDLSTEQPTEMLWLFEGFTAYFDHLILLHSNLISPEGYLKLLGNDIANNEQRPGWRYQTLNQSSLESWTKLYNGGEIAFYTSTSYYVHGALAAWCMDMFIREASNNAASLAEILRQIWQAQQIVPTGVDETIYLEAVLNNIPQSSHADFRALLHKLLHTTQPLPLEAAAAAVGIEIRMLAKTKINDLGTEANPDIRATTDPGFYWQERNDRYFITHLDPESRAAKAGMAMDDEILNINGTAVNKDNLWDNLYCGQALVGIACLTVLRDGISLHYSWELDVALCDSCLLSFYPSDDMAVMTRREQWCKQSQGNQS